MFITERDFANRLSAHPLVVSLPSVHTYKIVLIFSSVMIMVAITITMWTITATKTRKRGQLDYMLRHESFYAIIRAGWSAWLSGKTSVSDQRSFAVLRTTCS